MALPHSRPPFLQIILTPGVSTMSQKSSRQIRRSAHLLEACGYQCSPVRLGPFNLMGITPIDVILVQVRNTEDRWPPFPSEVDQMQHYTVPGNVKKIVHRWSTDHMRHR